MMNWLDIFLLVVFFLHLISGFTRGLIKQLFDLFGFFVAVALALWGSRYFSEELARFIDPEDIMPHHELFENLGLEVALERVPQLIAGIIAFLVLFLVLSLVFRLFSGGFRWVNRIPVIGFFNRVGGGFLGLLIGVVFVYIIIAGISLIPLQFFMEAMENSEIVFIAEHYLEPVAEELKEMLLNFYLTLNS